MAPSGTNSISTPPEADSPRWPERHAATRIIDVEHVGRMEAVVFRLGDGRILGVPIDQLQGADLTPVKRVSIEYDGDAAAIEQFSGNRLEVRWDEVLQRADRTNPPRPPEAGSPADAGRREADRAIGLRVRHER